MRKELGDIPDSSAMAAIITATNSPSSTAGAAGAAAGAGVEGAALLAGAAAGFLEPSILATILEITMMTAARIASIINTTTIPHTATINASGTLSGLLGFRIAFSTLGILLPPLSPG